MSPPTYYFVNSTRNEFCTFDDKIPILEVLTSTVNKYEWELQDNIKVESELSDSTYLIDYLINDKNYVWLDYDSDYDDESVPDSVA